MTTTSQTRSRGKTIDSPSPWAAPDFSKALAGRTSIANLPQSGGAHALCAAECPGRRLNSLFRAVSLRATPRG
jgi:hypothetical protein